MGNPVGVCEWVDPQVDVRPRLKVNFSSILLALYFYWRHNKYCEPGMYSGTYTGCTFIICSYLCAGARHILRYIHRLYPYHL